MMASQGEHSEFAGFSEGFSVRNECPLMLQAEENRGRYKPHFQKLPQVWVFSQVIGPQEETPNCHADRNFFPEFLSLTTAKTVASLQFLGKV
jgi:hypothetical protein